MVELLDQEPVTGEAARIWAESLSRDSSYEDAVAIAAALDMTKCSAYRERWPISTRNARLLRDALLAAARHRRH